MRHILRILGSRYGMAVVLTVLVLGVVALARTFTGTTTEANRFGPVVEPSSTPAVTGPTLGDDSEADAAGTSESVPQPSLSAGAADAEAVANLFITAWLKHTGVTSEQWINALTPHASQSLIRKLEGVDPAGVPADRVTGKVRVDRRDPSLVQVTIPVDSGLVRLRMIVGGGRWRVDGVDWERA